MIDALDRSLPPGHPANVARALRQRDVLHRQHELSSAHIRSLGGEVMAELVRAVNALQVRIPASRMARLAALPDVIRVEAVPTYQRSLTSAVPFVGAPQAWEMLPATGAGIRIGIIDTGIDYLHADFGGSGNPNDYKTNDRTIVEPGTFPTLKVAGGRDFVGDSYDGYTGIDPDDDPLDCFEEESTAIAGGHGTHVAGIAAGAGVNVDGTTFASSYMASLDPQTFRIFPGVAPEATLYALKIFGCDGGTNMVAAALDWAVDPNDDGDFSDRLDVVNMSLGGSYGLHSETDATLIRNVTEAGVLVVVAAGNDGDVFYVTGEPSTYTETLSVAATIDILSFLAMRIDSPAAVAGNVPCAEAAFSTPLATTGPMTGLLAASEPADACDTIQNPGALAGNIAFINRGDCYFVDKVQRAYEAGAIAAVIVDNVEQDEPFTMGGDGSQKPIPAVMIRLLDGDALRPYLPSGVTVTLDADNMFASETAPDQMASFTSRGPRSWDGRLKPDVAAPGVAILSAGVGSGTDPRESGGTSMACPMAAGAAAVLRQTHPNLDPLDIKAMMMNTTAPLANGEGIPVPVSLGGAGRIRVYDSASAELTAAAAVPEGAVSVSFNPVIAAEPRTETRDIIITNHGETSRTLSTSTIPTYDRSGVDVAVSPASISVPPNGSATVSVTLSVDPAALPLETTDPHTPAELIVRDEPYPRHFVNEHGGHVVLSDGSGAELRVPFHVILRAADQRLAKPAITCLDGDAEPISIPLDGLQTHKEAVVSVFQHAYSHGLNPTSDPEDRVTDLAEVGVAHDLSTAPSFSEGKLFFAVTVAADWTSPALGPVSRVGIAIDADADQAEDYVVYAEPYSQFRFRDILRAATYQVSSGERVSRLDLNVAPRDELNTELFNNNVVVLPVALEGIPELTETSAAFAFYAFTQHLSYPMMRESTPWIEYDPTDAPIDTAKHGWNGTPLYGPGSPVLVELNATEPAEPLPNVLLLHHANQAGKRVEIVSVGEAIAAYPNDLSVSQNAPAEMEAGTEQTWTAEVANTDGAEARDVAVSFAAAGGAAVLRLESDEGACEASTCTFDAIPVGAVIPIQVTVRASETAFDVTADVGDAAVCDLDDTNNRAVVHVAVNATPPWEPSGTDGGMAGADLADFTAGGGCGCGVAGSGGSWGSAALAALALLIGRRRRTSEIQR